jgi:hypothetical protein
MSLEALNWARKQQCEPAAKLLLLAIANHLNEDGYCWPSVRTLQEWSCLSRASVFRHLAALQAMNIIRREDRRRADGGQASSCYWICALEPTPVSPEDPPRLTVRPRESSVEPSNPYLTEGESGKGKPARPPKWWESDPLYPQFREAWTSLPLRKGGEDKGAAFKAYCARLKEGVAHEEMLAGAQAYAIHCDETGKTETEFVMQGRTFFGPARRWEAYLPEAP